MGGIGPLISIMQLPLVISWFLCLRYFTTMPDVYPALTTSGLFWFKDLTVYDPTLALPLISAFTSYLNIQVLPILLA